MTIETTITLHLPDALLLDCADALLASLMTEPGVCGAVTSVSLPERSVRVVFDADSMDAAIRGLQVVGRATR